MVAQAFEMLATGAYLEGLAVDRERNIVWYSDVTGGGVHGVCADGSTRVFDRERRWTGGIALNFDGSVLSSGPGGIRWNNPANGGSGWLLDRIDGQVINGINEMAPDGAGGLYFGTCDLERVVQGQPTRPVALYRLTRNRELRCVAEGIGFANGLAFDAARMRLYCNDTFSCTWAFDVNPDGTLDNKRCLIEKDDVDGIALDGAGNVWITGFRSGSLTRIAVDGSGLPPVQTPGRAVTQLRFGGPDMRDIYLNTVPVDAGESLKNGLAVATSNSCLYRGRCEVPGMVLAPTRFLFD